MISIYDHKLTKAFKLLKLSYDNWGNQWSVSLHQSGGRMEFFENFHNLDNYR